VIEVAVPPLRDRADDIPLLTQLILDRLAGQLQLHPAPSLSKAAMNALREHRFPGNIRELENMLERAVTLSDNTVIETDLLRLDAPLGPARSAATTAGGDTADGGEGA